MAAPKNHGSGVTARPRRPARATRGVTLAEIRRWPAAVDVSLSAQAYGVSRASAYQAIADGTYPAQVVRVNRRMKVITASIIASLEGSGIRESA